MSFLDLLPFRVLIGVSFTVLLLLSLLKLSVDVCLPNYSLEPLFPQTIAVPRTVCEKIVRWDSWARFRKAEVMSRTSVFDSGPGVFETDDGKPGFILFGKDLVKLTVLLAEVPQNKTASLQIGITALIITLLSTIIVAWTRIITKVKSPEEKQVKVRTNKKRKRHLTATRIVISREPDNNDRNRR